MSEQKFEHFQQVLVRNDEKNVWVCGFYSHYRENPCLGYNHICTGGEDWKYCIPYEGNEHLAGTSESPEEKEKFEFGDKVAVSDFKNAIYRNGIFVGYNDENSKYVVLSESSHTINEWRYCKKGWDE